MENEMLPEIGLAKMIPGSTDEGDTAVCRSTAGDLIGQSPPIFALWVWREGIWDGSRPKEYARPDLWWQIEAGIHNG
jgi:hypothetical protein